MYGGKYIAHGSFGVVFSPPISCKDSKVKLTSDDIGKVFVEQNEFEEEINMMKMISGPLKSFAIPIKSTCEINSPTEKDIKGLPKKFNVTEGLPQIIYKNGGIDLQHIIQQKHDTDDVTRFKWGIKIFKALQPIMEGLCILQEQGLTHNDIKPMNILYNSSIGKCSLIDWGLAVKTSENYVNVGVKNAVYPYYPPDYQLAVIYSQTLKVPSVIEILQKNFSVFKRNINVVKLYEKFGIDLINNVQLIDKHISSLIKTNKLELLRFFQSYAYTVDLYSLGISLLQILNDLNILDYNNIKIFAIKRFVARLINVDPRLRFSPKSALKEYKEILELL